MKYFKYVYHASVLTLVLYTTWCVLQLNAAVNAISAFLMQLASGGR